MLVNGIVCKNGFRRFLKNLCIVYNEINVIFLLNFYEYLKMYNNSENYLNEIMIKNFKIIIMFYL